MKPSWQKLLLALHEPSAMGSFDASTWDTVIRQAMAARLLGRLGALANAHGDDFQIPVAVRHHLEAALTLAEQQHRAVCWELVQLSKTLSDLDGPVVLIKGAAYTAAGLAPAAGRLFSDIDILVPKSQIDAAEAALMLGGWNSSHHDAYEQRYYRQWMHELPPMSHIRRQTVLDLHHNILPETARIKTRPDLILASSRPLKDFPRFSVPAPADQILHSATHLFHEGEWEHGLRDLADLDALLRDYGREPSFWNTLLQRARDLGLGKPLFYGLRYCRLLLATPMPSGILENCPNRPAKIMARTMDGLFMPAFATAHHSCRQWSSGPASLCLYIRSHWLRMPLHLLLPHLIRKSWQRRVESLFKKKTDTQENPTAP